jgi:ribonucleotide reductase beta subunit family protein with ferritin-like domain
MTDPTPLEIASAVEVLMRNPGKVPSKLLLQMIKSKLPRSEIYSAFPIKDERSWRFYCLQEAADWSAKSLEWKEDRKQFPSLPARYQQLFLQLFGIFSPLDGAVSANVLRLACEAPTYNAMMFLIMQMKIELTHSEAYGQAAMSVPISESHKREVFEFVDKQICVQHKTNFIEKYIESDESWALRSVAAACSEGIFFVSLFSIIFYFRNKGILKTFVEMNSYVMKDETLHRGFYCSEANVHLKPEEYEKAKSIISESVEIELEMIRFLLKEPIDSIEADTSAGLTIENLENYVRGLGDQISELCGMSKIYNVSYEPPWCQDMVLNQKQNFYEVKDGTYKKFDPEVGMDWERRAGLVNDVETNITERPEEIDF